jgi:hypothetical protein
MSIKFGANYVLAVQGADGNTITISYPLTIDFNITRMAWSSVEECTIRVRNLNLQTRTNIFKDWQDMAYWRTLKLNAGYGVPPSLPTIFNGGVRYAYSFKDSGSTDNITEITGWIGYVPKTAQIHRNLPGSPTSPVPQQAVVNALVDNLVSTPNSLVAGNTEITGLSRGYISKFTKSYPRGRTLMGNTWNLLQQETNYSAYINNNKINILQNFDSFDTKIYNINADTGLLSSPRRSQAWVDVEILFEPNIESAGQLVNLTSQTGDPKWNGVYKVVGLEHRGIISGSVNGKRVTKLRLQAQSQQFNQIPSSEGVQG